MARVRVVPISEARSNLANLVEEIGQSREPCFIASRSKVKAVLLGIEEYDSLMERLEDLEDSLDILKARTEGEPSRSLEDFLRQREVELGHDVQRPA